MQEKASSASFALLGRTYLQPSSHVLATVLALLAGKDDNNLFFLLTPGIHIPKLAGKKKDCVAIGTQSDMYV